MAEGGRKEAGGSGAGVLRRGGGSVWHHRGRGVRCGGRKAVVLVVELEQRRGVVVVLGMAAIRWGWRRASVSSYLPSSPPPCLSLRREPARLRRHLAFSLRVEERKEKKG